MSRSSSGLTPRASLVALSLLLPFAAFALASAYDYFTTIGRAEEQSASTADALAEHARTVLQTIDLVLDRVEDRIGTLDWDAIGKSEEIYRFLAKLAGSLPQVESVFLVDPQGYNSASSRGFPMPHYDDRSREYFTTARDGYQGLLIGAPFKGQAAGTVAFTVSRALQRGGQFDGVVAVTMHPNYFRAFYGDTLKRTDGASAALVRRDGVVLVRSAAGEEVPRALPESADIMQSMVAGQYNGAVWGRSVTTGAERLLTFRRVSDHDLIVTYSRTAGAILAPWYVDSGIFAALAILAAASLFFAVRQATARYEKEQASLRVLLAETERRQQAEESLEKARRMEALGRLTGGLAHDFNNILAGMLGAFELLGRSITEPRARRIIEQGIAAGRRGAQITAEMLAFAQKRKMELKAVDVQALMAGLDDLIRRTAGPLCRVSYDLDPTAAPALSDPTQLELALLNLVANGRDAMPLGGELTISVKNAIGLPPPLAAGGGDGRSFVVVSVKDTGIGMSEEVRAKAFEPFFTTKGPGKGTGLGLANVYGMVSQAGGGATIESDEGRGTTVHLFLPRAESLAPPAAGAAEPAAAEVRPLRILLVDDDALVRDTTAGILAAAGHEVVAAADPPSALASLRSDARFDLLILDYAMPVMTGGQLAAEVRTLRPDLPIMFMTAYVHGDGLRPWAEEGHVVLYKPFSSEQLATAIDQAIAGDRSPRPAD